MNSDGTQVRQLATSTSDEPNIKLPQWSPDGKWTLLKEGSYTGSGGSGPGGFVDPGNSGYAYVVPAEDMGKVFVLSNIDSERSPEVLQVKRYSYRTTPDDPFSSTTDKYLSADVYWIH